MLVPPQYLEQDYEQNGFGEKRGRVRLNRLRGCQMVERYGARVEKAQIGRGFQKERESVGVEITRVSRGFGKQRKDRGTNSESSRVLICEGSSKFNLHSAVPSCVAISSCVAIPYGVGISSCGGVSSCVGFSSCVGSSVVSTSAVLFQALSACASVSVVH